MPRPQKIRPNQIHGVWTHAQRGVDYLYRIRLHAVGGRVAVVEFHLDSFGYHPVTHEALNRFPLADVVRDHVARSDFDTMLEAMQHDPDATAAERRSARLMLKARSPEGDSHSGQRLKRKRHATGPARDERIRDELVPRYFALRADPTVKAINKKLGAELGLSAQTIANDVSRARKLGLLPPTRPTKPTSPSPKKKGTG